VYILVSLREPIQPYFVVSNTGSQRANDLIIQSECVGDISDDIPWAQIKINIHPRPKTLPEVVYVLEIQNIYTA
jgi:hypothetical protein